MKQKKLTIYDIKYLTEDTEPFFFSRKTLKFFHQTLKDFKVRYSPMGRIFLFAPIHMHNKVIGYTAREYNQDTKKLDRIDYERSIHPAQEYCNIQSYINQH